MKPFFQNLIAKKYSYLATLSHAVKVQLSLTMSFQMISFSSEALGERRNLLLSRVYIFSNLFLVKISHAIAMNTLPN